MKKIMFSDKNGLTQAVLEGRKTQTRRIITPQPTYQDNCGICWKGYAYGLRPIDFKEPFGSYMNFVLGTEYDKSCRRYRKGEVVAVAQSYETSWQENASAYHNPYFLRELPGWKNKMFVAARDMLHQIRITDVRVERLQDIVEDDCLREGLEWDAKAQKYYAGYVKGTEKKNWLGCTPREAFAELINKVSRKDVWSLNPYVFVYDFELVK